MAGRSKQSRQRISTSRTGLPDAKAIACLPAADASPISVSAITANSPTADMATEARAKRLALIQALGRQAARELAAQALAARDE